MILTLAEVDAVAEAAHAGQSDKIGVPYIEHVRAVARGLAPLGEHMRMAGLLHDILEDTYLTAQQLLDAGVPPKVVDTVSRVTRGNETYDQFIRAISTDRAATLVKIADNAHNSHPDRTAALPPDRRERLARKYQLARDVLWPKVAFDELFTVVSGVNPALLEHIHRA